MPETVKQHFCRLVDELQAIMRAEGINQLSVALDDIVVYTRLAGGYVNKPSAAWDALQARKRRAEENEG